MLSLLSRLFLGLCMLVCSARLSAQVSVSATAGTTGPTAYTTLKAAFDAINAGTHQGAITIGISASTTETAPAVLNGNATGAALYTSVLIQPTADAVTISGTVPQGRGVIELNGADNVTINGDNPGSAGTNRNLTVANAASATTTYTSVVRVATGTGAGWAEADNIQLRNLVITGSAAGRNLSTATSTTGSENTTFGIYAGGNGGSAIGAVTSVTSTSAASGTTINTFVVDNCAVNSCARGIVFNGAAISVSSGVTITNNTVGASGAVTPATPPFTSPATSVYTKGIWIAGTGAVSITGNTVQNILSYVATTMTGIELNGAIGSAATVSNNTINTMSQNGSGTGAVKAIQVSSGNGTFTVAGNTISNIWALSGSSGTAGIDATFTGTSGTIENNRVSAISNRNAGTWGAWGINLGGGTAITVRNNFVSDITTDMTAGSFGTTFVPIGIRVNGGTNHRIYHNTMHLFGTLPGTAPTTGFITAAFAINANTLTGLDVRNNIFSNALSTGSSTTAVNVALFLPSAGTSAMNLILNNNAYYTGATATQGLAQVGTTAGTGFYATANFSPALTTPATNLRAYSSTLSGSGTNDNSSFASSSAAPFVSNTDLHINTGTTPTQLESGGASVGVTTDIDGHVRPGPASSSNGGGYAADMGADEFDGAPLDVSAPSIVYTALTFACSTGDRTLSGVTITDGSGVPTTGNLRPRIYYKKSTGATWFSQPGTLTAGNGTNGTWSFTIVAADMGGLAANDIVQYYVIAQDTWSTPNVGSSPSGATASNVNTVTAHPATPSTYTISSNFSGTFTVGASGTYTSLAAASAAYNVGCLNGPVVFSLTDATYTETGAITFSNPIASATNTLTIRPAAGVNAAINGNVNGAFVRLFGNYITIDGNNGSNGRNLTITNNATTSPNVIVIGSAGTTPATDVNVDNSILVNGSNTSSALVISDAGTLGNPGYFNNIRINNNSIQKAYIGVYANAATATTNGSGTVISNNDINATGTNAIRLVGIYVQGANGVNVTGNKIANFDATNDENDRGIWFATGTNGSNIERNTITNLGYTGTGGYSGQGIFVSSGVASANIRVANNFIANMTGDGWNYTTTPTDNPMGIGLSGTQGGITLYHNSIHLYGNTLNQASAMSMGVFLGTGSTASLVNNMIVNNLGLSGTTGYGSVGVYAASANTQFTTINNNNYWTNATGSGSKFLGQIGTTGAATLAAWQSASGGDAASRNIQPTFTSNTDLHLNPATNASLDNLGTPVGVTQDIDGDTRNATTPDIGADEFGTACVAPAITTQPSAAAVCAGTNASFTVAATGTGLTYQWRKNGTNINGATSATLSFSPAAAGDAGNYDVVITGTCGNVTSAQVALTVNTAPAITTQPTAQAACPGNNVTFTVAATGTGLTYQWRKGGTNIAGATSATLTLNSVTAADAANYDVIVSGTCTPSVTSTAVALTVGGAPVINTQPTSQAACAGDNVNFSVAAAGSGLTYQWKKDGTDISGATSATLTLNNVTAASAGSYTVVVTSSCATSTTSSAATLTLNIPVSITMQPTALAACSGGTATFTVAATGTGLTYQWRKGGTNISGATSATLTLNNIAAADAANYDVVVSGTCAPSVTSNAVALTINTAPSITTQPQSQTICSGSNVTFSVTATGTGITYQWRKGGTAISGATGASYTINNVSATDAATYDVVVSGTCTPAVTSSGAVLTIAAANTWVGATSTAWNTAANWCGGVPSSTSDIVIPAGTPFSPSVSTTQDVRNLTISSGATLTVAAGGRLNVFGNLVNNGIVTATSGTVAFQGTGAQTTTALSASTVIINGAGVTLNGNMSVGTTLTLTSGHLTLGANNLTVNGTVAGSAASHIITNGTGSVISNNIGTTATVIPVAPDATSYNPVTITNGAGRNYTVRVATGINPAIANPARAVNRTWTITPSTAPGTNVDISLQFADADANASAVTTSAMEVGVHTGTVYAIASPTAGVTPTGTAAARVVSYSSQFFGPTVVTSPGGINYPTSIPGVNADVTSVQLLPNVVEGPTTLRVIARRSVRMEFVVTDATGRRVMSFSQAVTAGTNDVPLYLGSLATGSYLLTGTTGQGMNAVIRFVRQ